MEIILNNENKTKNMNLNDDMVNSQVMIEHIISGSTINLAVYYSYMTSFAVFTCLILNYLMPELNISTTQVMLMAIGLISLWFYPVAKYKCENEDKCEQVAIYEMINDSETDKVKHVKFKYDTSFARILQVLVWAIILSVIVEKILIKIINVTGLRNKLGLKNE